MTKVLAISGSLRHGSMNTALVHALARTAPGGVIVSVYDRLEHLPFFNPDLAPSAEVRQFQAALHACDAVVISSPEYAHGVPGVLKNALDWLVGSGELIDKPVALLNASSRATHAWSSLMETLTVMSAKVIENASITLPLDGSKLGADGIAAHPLLSLRIFTALQVLAAATRTAPE
jgi:NAD(P)H-dependent FMN reductase